MTPATKPTPFSENSHPLTQSIRSGSAWESGASETVAPSMETPAMSEDTTNARANPGSPEAVSQGCTCPVIDNHHGEGRPTIGGQSFIYAGNCPFHIREGARG